MFEAGGAGGTGGDESVQNRTPAFLRFLVTLPSVTATGVEGTGEDGQKGPRLAKLRRYCLLIPACASDSRHIPSYPVAR